MNSQIKDGPAFGLAFRVIVGTFALLSGAILWLWASQLSEVWKYIPAVFCFAIVGVVALPKPIALACGYFVAITVVLLSAWFLYLDFSGESGHLAHGIHFAEVYGLPSLAFILYRQIPGRHRDAR